MLYLHVSLSKSRLCHALCLPWACAYVVTFVPSRVCLNVTTCEIHSHGVSVLDIVDTAFCTAYDSSPHSPMMLEL